MDGCLEVAEKIFLWQVKEKRMQKAVNDGYFTRLLVLYR